MPFEIMDQRDSAAASHFFEDVRLPAERKSRFLKLNAMPDHHHLGEQHSAFVGTDIMAPVPGSKTFALSPLEKPSPTGALLLNDMRSSHPVMARDEKEKPLIAEENSNMSMKSLNSMDHLPNSWSALSIQHLNGGLGRIRDGMAGSQWESSLFSSSFSDVFNRNLQLSSNDVLSQHMAKNVSNLCEEEEPYEALEEIEAKTIGNLLPAEDDLFSGVTNELGCNGPGSGGDDLEDIDLFSNLGGLEMEGDDRLVRNPKNSYPVGVSPAQGSSNFPIAKTHWGNELASNRDARAVEAALSAFKNGDLAGKLINLEPKFVASGQSSVQQLKLEKGKHGLGEGLFSNLSSTQIAFSPAASCVENGTSPVLHSTIQVPIGAFTEPPRVSGIPMNLPSSVSVASAGKSYSLLEPSHLTDAMKSVNQCIPIFHPHSFPEYHDSLANGFPYNSSNVIGGISSSVGSKVIGGVNNTHIRVGNPMDINEGGVGSSENGDCTLRQHHYMWNNSNSDWQHPSTHMIWPNSPSFRNNINLSHMPGFARPIMVDNTAPANHHVGSAPAINPSLWDRRHAYPGETSETSSFRLGTLGSVGFPCSSPPNPMEIATRNVFPHVVGSLVDMTKNAGVGSPQRMCHNFPGRNAVISGPTSFDSQNDRMRSFSHRRVDSNSNPADKKQYELDIDRILRGEDGRTTLMIKNIPNKYTSKMLLAAIDEQCRGTYDFIYLPIDFKNKCNVGYAFINMVDAQRIIPFYKAFNGKKWEKFNSEKVANLAYARIQGKAALIAHFQNSSLMNEDKLCRPILFHTDGPNAGDPEPFPIGSHIRPRLSKSRSSGNGRGNLSTVVNAEDSGNGTDSSSCSD